MFCPACGKELSDNAKFCGGCGIPIKSEATTDTTAAETPIAESMEKEASTEAPKPTAETSSVATPAKVEPAKEATATGAANFKAAGSGANPFASIKAKAKEATDVVSGAASTGRASFSGALNERMVAMNEGAEAKAFSGSYAKTAESEDIAQKAKKLAEERAERRAAAKAKAEKRRGKKPVIAGFSDEEETSGPEHAVFAEGLPDWDLVPATPFMVDKKPN